SSRWQPLTQCVQLHWRQILRRGLLENSNVRSVGIEERLGDALQRSDRGWSHNTGSGSTHQRRANIHHRLGEGGIAVVCCAVSRRHFVVVFDLTVPVGVKDFANADHPETLKFDGAKGSHAGAAKNTDTTTHGPQNFFVPKRGDALLISVDDADG